MSRTVVFRKPFSAKTSQAAIKIRSRVVGLFFARLLMSQAPIQGFRSGTMYGFNPDFVFGFKQMFQLYV
jgi:hypothetical protein